MSLVIRNSPRLKIRAHGRNPWAPPLAARKRLRRRTSSTATERAKARWIKQQLWLARLGKKTKGVVVTKLLPGLGRLLGISH